MKYIIMMIALGLTTPTFAEEEPKQQQVNEKVNKLKQYLAERKAKQEAAKKSND